MLSRPGTMLRAGALFILVVVSLWVLYHKNGGTTAPTYLSGNPVDTATRDPDVYLSTATTTATSSDAEKTESSTATSSAKKAKKASIQAIKSTPAPEDATSSPNEIVRVKDPYPNPPLSFESVNVSAREALVNILCATRSVGTLKPITGSGVMVDERGVILTNAHVAQYVLIAQSGRSDLSCVVRTGAPAAPKWIPVVMYIPSVWIDTHAADILRSNAIGTGEHDYALLYIASTVDGSPRPATFPAVPPDTREAIAFVDDHVLVASYPVEFVGNSIISADLFPVTSITTVGRLMTFGVGSADALSLGGVIGAQSGSSGGGVVNQWNRLVGIITTTSLGATTAERDLHSISTAYINRDIQKQTGKNLTETLAMDPEMTANAFAPEAAVLAQKLISAILGR